MPKLLWSDEFTSLDLVGPGNTNGRWRASDTWQGDKGFVDFGSGGSWCANPAEAVNGVKYNPFSIQNGVLVITSTRTTDANRAAMAGMKWWGGILVSNTRRSDMTFTYGYYEVRMRLPNKGKGMFPALWLFAANGQNDGTNKGHAEIDLLEVFGYPAGTPWSTTLHEKDNNGGGPQYGIYSKGDDTTDWHTYGVDWRVDRLDFYKDRVKVASGNSRDIAYFAGTKMSLRFNYAMDAGWFDSSQKSDGSTPDHLRMEIDYVRQYDGVPAPGELSPVDTAPVVVTPPPPAAPTAPPTTPAPTNTAAGVTESSPAPAAKPKNDQAVNLPVVWPHYGFSDNVTRSVQALLSARGYTVALSSTWTPDTTTQLKAFQKAKGLTATGVVSADTWARLLYG